MAKKEKEKKNVAEEIGKALDREKENIENQKKEHETWWKSKTQSQKAQFVVSLVVFFVVLAGILFWACGRDILGYEATIGWYGAEPVDELGELTPYPSGWSYIGSLFQRSSTRWLFTFLILLCSYFVVFSLNFVIGLFSYRGKKAKTVGSLAKSLIRYIVFIFALGGILTVWGVDIASIVAGIGILTLIIGLGCQTLIADVVSGLFIVIDDLFDVGDTVIIDGFRGTVNEIGLKTTKLLDGGGNLKEISNSSVTSVVNLTRHLSLITCTMDAAYGEDVERVESIIAQELPGITERIPMLESKVEYKGISGFDQAGVQYFFLCKTQESFRFQVQRDLNREIYMMFVRNNIAVPYNQITVSQADTKPRPKATKEDKALAEKITAVNRAMPAEEKRKNLLQRARDSFDVTSRELDGK